MRLLYTSCVPLLKYSCEVSPHDSKEKVCMDVALNDCTKKIFTFNQWESTRELRRAMGYDPITEIFAKQKASFDQSILLIANPLLARLYDVISNSQ